MMMNVQGAAIKKTPLRKMHYCHSGSKHSCQIFRLCSLNTLLSAVLVLLYVLQYFSYNRGLNI